MKLLQLSVVLLVVFSVVCVAAQDSESGTTGRQAVRALIEVS